MYNHLLDTFIEVADNGSFLKASEKLFISPTAVMKQMNLLEQQIGVTLLIRTNQGIRLTDAGKSFYKDAKSMIQLSEKAIERAQKAQKKKNMMVRIGTSALYPCKELTDLWNENSSRYPYLKLKIVPFEDTYSQAAFANLGKKYDLIIGPHNSVTVAKFSNFIELGKHDFCIAVPKTHMLASKKSISYENLYGEQLLMQTRGNSPVNDRIRDEIVNKHPKIQIVDVPQHYSMEVFNKCIEDNCTMLSLSIWREIHPSLVSIPFQIEEKIPYGILSALNPSEETRKFLEVIRSIHTLPSTS